MPPVGTVEPPNCFAYVELMEAKSASKPSASDASPVDFEIILGDGPWFLVGETHTWSFRRILILPHPVGPRMGTVAPFPSFYATLPSMLTITKTLPQILLALAILAVAGILGARYTLTSADSFSMVMAVLGAVGISGGIILGSGTPNVTLVTHLVIFLAALGVVVALGVLGVYSSQQILSVVALAVGGGAWAAGNASAPPAAAPSITVNVPPGTPVDLRHPSACVTQLRDRPEDSVAGTSPSGAERPTRVYASGRICRTEDCETVLSVYNNDEWCSVHHPQRSLRMRGRQWAR